MEILIDGWDWLNLREMAEVGLMYCSIVAAAIIFGVGKKFSKPEK